MSHRAHPTPWIEVQRVASFQLSTAEKGLLLQLVVVQYPHFLSAEIACRPCCFGDLVLVRYVKHGGWSPARNEVRCSSVHCHIFATIGAGDQALVREMERLRGEPGCPSCRGSPCRGLSIVQIVEDHKLCVLDESTGPEVGHLCSGPSAHMHTWPRVNWWDGQRSTPCDPSGHREVRAWPVLLKLVCPLSSTRPSLANVSACIA